MKTSKILIAAIVVTLFLTVSCMSVDNIISVCERDILGAVPQLQKRSNLYPSSDDKVWVTNSILSRNLITFHLVKLGNDPNMLYDHIGGEVEGREYSYALPVDIDHSKFLAAIMESLAPYGINPIFIDGYIGGKGGSSLQRYKMTIIYLDSKGSRFELNTYRGISTDYVRKKFEEGPVRSTVGFYYCGNGSLPPIESFQRERSLQGWADGMDDRIVAWHKENVMGWKSYQELYNSSIQKTSAFMDRLAMEDAGRESWTSMLSKAFEHAQTSSPLPTAPSSSGSVPAPGSIPLRSDTIPSAKKGSSVSGTAYYTGRTNVVFYVVYGPGEPFPDYESALAESQRRYLHWESTCIPRTSTTKPSSSGTGPSPVQSQ